MSSPDNQAAEIFINRWKKSGGHERGANRLARGDEEIEQVILTRLVELNHERAAEKPKAKFGIYAPNTRSRNTANRTRRPRHRSNPSHSHKSSQAQVAQNQDLLETLSGLGQL